MAAKNKASHLSCDRIAADRALRVRPLNCAKKETNRREITADSLLSGSTESDFILLAWQCPVSYNSQAEYDKGHRHHALES